MPWSRRKLSRSVSTPKVDVSIDTGCRFLNLFSDGFLMIGNVAATRAAAEDTFHIIQKGAKGVSEFHPYATIINHIRGLLAKDWSLTFNHTLREDNKCADWLAKQGSSSDSCFVVREHCPAQLSCSMLADAVGVARRRPRS